MGTLNSSSLLRPDFNSRLLVNPTVDEELFRSLTNPGLYPPASPVPPKKDGVSDAAKEVESALKALREAKDKEAQRRASEALDKATKKLKEQVK
jgi:hypothetical protein